MYYSKNLLTVNPVVMNYKIRHNKNRPVTRPERYSLAWPDHFSVIVICSGRKMVKQSGHVRLYARVAMEEGLLSV